MVGNFIKRLEPREQKAFGLHLGYSFIDGMMRGALIMNEFVFIKSLQGSNYQLGMLFQFSVIVLIFSVLFNELLRRSGNKRRFLRIVAIFTHLPLLLLLFFPRQEADISADSVYHLVFLFIFLFYFLSRPLVFPTINLLLKHNYRHNTFGRLYSIATSLNKALMLITTLAYGVLLDHDHYAFAYVFPVLGVAGVFSIFLLSRIEYEEPLTVIKRSFIDSLKTSFINLGNILKKNIPYRHYEISFMFYGFAFMSTKAVITLFYKDALDLNYSSVAFYENSFNILTIILLPVFGKIIGKTDPRKFVVYTYMALALFISFIGLTEYFPFHTEIWGLQIYYFLLTAIVFKGIFAATMALSWSIGSSYFCKKEEAGDYQSVHLTLTGTRGLVAPLIGIYFYELFDFSGTFGIAVVSLIVAMALMQWSYKNFRVFKVATVED
jgi:hypothetical protein